MEIKLLVLTLLLLVETNIFAQEKLTPEEMFRWFPEGKYESVVFKDLETARDMPGFEKYLTHRNVTALRWAHNLFVPFKLRDQWLTLTQMQSVKSLIYEGNIEREFGRGGMLSTASFNGKDYTISSFGYPMQCIRFPLDLDLSKIVAGSQGFQKTGELLYTMPIYQYQSNDPGPFSPDFYLYITFENEILACEDLKYLKKMVATGNGDYNCVNQDFPFPALMEIIPDLGPDWLMFDPSVSSWAFIKKLEKENVEEEILQAKRDSISRRALSIFLYRYPEDPVQERISLYPDEELTISGYQLVAKYWHKKNPYGWRSELNTYVHLQTTLKRENNLVIQSLVFTEKYLEKMAEFRKEREGEIKKEIKKEGAKRIQDYLLGLVKKEKTK